MDHLQGLTKMDGFFSGQMRTVLPKKHQCFKGLTNNYVPKLQQNKVMFIFNLILQDTEEERHVCATYFNYIFLSGIMTLYSHDTKPANNGVGKYLDSVSCKLKGGKQLCPMASVIKIMYFI